MQKKILREMPGNLRIIPGKGREKQKFLGDFPVGEIPAANPNTI